MAFRPPTREDAPAIVKMLIACDVVDFGTPDYDGEALMAEWTQPGVDLERDAFLTDGAYGILLGRWRAPGCTRTVAARASAARSPRGWRNGRARRASPRSSSRRRAAPRARGRCSKDAATSTCGRSSSCAWRPRTSRPHRPASASASTTPRATSSSRRRWFERELAGGRGRLVPLEGVLAARPDTSLWFCAEAPDGSLAGGLRSELRPAGFITGQITQVVVEPAHRGAGTGRALVAAASRELADRGADTIRVAVRSDAPDALAFFEALGFRGEPVIGEMRLAL